MRKVAILFAILSISIPCSAGLITVDDDGSADYSSLQDALAGAGSGDQILVAEGIYKPDQGSGITPGDKNAAFQLKNGVEIYGGYLGFAPGDPNERDIDLYETILSGDLNGDDGPNFANNGENSYHVVTGSGIDETAVLDGVSISGGNVPSDRGGGMYNFSASPTVTNCKFRKNSGQLGGGIANRSGSNPTLTNCAFINNNSPYVGGGMYNYQSNPLLVNCVFIGNTSSNQGGAVNNSGGGNPEMINCIFSGNSTGSFGGAMFNYTNTHPKLVNCIFSGNSSDHSGGAMFNSTSSAHPELINCTFSGNVALYHGGVDGGNPSITNCIFWGNGDQNGTGQSAQLKLDGGSINYSCVQGWSGSLGGIGNIGDDPLFIDSDGIDNIVGTEDDDLRLLSTSTCINTGDNNAVPTEIITDLYGNPRIKDGIVDMGVYEGDCVWPVIGISQTLFDFTAMLGDANPEDQILTITNNGVGILNWEITETCTWLSVDLNSGSSTGQADDVTLSVDISGLSGGIYSCDLIITGPNATNSPRIVAVNLVVDSPVIGISQTPFDFTAILGGANPEDQILTITNNGVDTLNWEITEACSWLSQDPDTGSSTGEANDVILSVDISGLSAGIYNCDLIITDPYALNSPVIIPVSLEVIGPEIELSATSFSFSRVEGGTNPSDQSLVITNAAEATLNWQITKSCSWVNVTPSSGSLNNGEADIVTISIDMTGLSRGVHQCVLTVSDPDAHNSPQTVVVTLNIVPVVLNYSAQTYAYAYAVTLGYFGFAVDSDTDSDSSSNGKSESLAQARAIYSSSPAWDVEWQKSNTHADVEGSYDPVGAWIVSSLDGWGQWYYYSQFGGWWGTGPGGGTGNGYTSLSGTMEIGIFENCPQGSCGVILNLDAALTGDIPSSLDNWDWYFKVWDTDPNNPLVVLNDGNMSAKLNVVTGEIYNIELYHEAEENNWPTGGLDSTLTIDITAPPVSDINVSGTVDFGDFAILSSQWQDVPGTPSADIAPAGGDNFVGIDDLMALAENWLWP